MHIRSYIPVQYIIPPQGQQYSYLQSLQIYDDDDDNNDNNNNNNDNDDDNDDVLLKYNKKEETFLHL
jgi:hypothetical protein